jgi:hypothetical protein
LTDADNEETSLSKADAKALTQQGLPVPVNKTCHHDTEDHQHRSDACQRTSVASIKQRTSDHQRDQDEETLHGSDPRQLALCRVPESARRGVVSLIHAVAVHESPVHVRQTLGSGANESEDFLYQVLKVMKNETKIWLRLFQSVSVGGLCCSCSASWPSLRSGVVLEVLGVLHVDGGFESSPMEENRFSLDSDAILRRDDVVGGWWDGRWRKALR